MKKPFLLLSLLLTFGLHADCAAWGTVGHRAIAEVAQRHLTPKAKPICVLSDFLFALGNSIFRVLY